MKKNKMRYNYIISFIVIVLLLFTGVNAYSTKAAEPDKEYWPNGKVRMATTYNELGGLGKIMYYREDGTLEQQIKYDMDGHKIEESYYNAEGKLHENADGWAVLKNRYEGGKLRVEAYYTADGHLKEQKEYNELGDLVGKQYVGDDNILPAEEYNPLPTGSGETTTYYDSYGRKEGSTSAVSGFYGDWAGWELPVGERDPVGEGD